MDISYVIITHSNPIQLRRLIDRLQAPGVVFFVHVDKKAKIEPFLSETASCDNVVFVENRLDVRWGDYSVVEAYLECLKVIRREAPGSFVFHLSGQDYPIKSNARIREFVDSHASDIFVKHHTLPTKDWVGNGGMDRVNLYFYHIRKRQYVSIVPRKLNGHNIRSILKTIRRPSVLLQLIANMFRKRSYPLEVAKHYGGEFWISMPEAAASRILDFMQRNPEVEKYYKLCGHPDEIMLHTLICNADYLQEFTIVNSTLKYIEWRDKRGASLPLTLIWEDKDDVDIALTNPQQLFARKFDSAVDDKIIGYIDEIISVS